MTTIRERALAAWQKKQAEDAEYQCEQEAQKRTKFDDWLQMHFGFSLAELEAEGIKARWVNGGHNLHYLQIWGCCPICDTEVWSRDILGNLSDLGNVLDDFQPGDHYCPPYEPSFDDAVTRLVDALRELLELEQ